MMDSSTESPLDVLSRAATMVQDNTLPPSYDEAQVYLKCKELKELASVGKWKRERRSRPATITPPAYSQKLPPGHPEPIDMSTRRLRGSPPSYSQSISAAGYLNQSHINRASVITSCNTNNNGSGISDGGSMCDDPVIEEHFRRSLKREDYQSVFAPSNRQRIASNGQTDDSSDESGDLTGSALSVDEHFAKALGQSTWLQIQRKRKTSTSNPITINKSRTPSTTLSSSAATSLTSSASTTSSGLTSSTVTSTTEHKDLLRRNRYED